MNTVTAAHWIGVGFHYASLLVLGAFALWMAGKMLRKPPVTANDVQDDGGALVTVMESQAGLVVGANYRFTDSLSFGRSPANDVIINEPYVSHEHACIIRQRKQYVLVDLGSRNGSKINGDLCEKDTVLADGDVISIGSVSFTFKR